MLHERLRSAREGSLSSRPPRRSAVDNHFFAAWSAASRTAGCCLTAKTSRSGSLLPPALATMMPFDGFGRVGRHAATGHQDARQPVLRDWTAQMRRLQEKACGRSRFVLGRAVSIELSDRELNHRIDDCRRRKPAA